MVFARLGRLAKGYLLGAVFGSSLLCSSLKAQQQPTYSDLVTPPDHSYFEKYNKPTQSFFSHTLDFEIKDRFDRYSLQFQRLHDHLTYRDDLQIDERLGNSARRRVERSFTRTFTEMLERTPAGEQLVSWFREGEWRSIFYDTTKDALIDDDQQNMGAIVVPDTEITSTTHETGADHAVKYDLDKPVVQKPFWKRNVNFFVKPFSMHPYVGLRWKLDGNRIETRIYHDSLRFAGYIPITPNMNAYTSVNMKRFDAEEISFNLGFQHNLKLPGSSGSGLLQYGFALNNVHFSNGRGMDREYRPRGFLAFVYNF